MLQTLLTGGVLGIIGQGVRVLVGLKKLREETNSPQNANFEEAFDAPRLIVTIFIGFIAGALGALSMGLQDNREVTNEIAYSLVGIGYMGVDFIEGIFLSKIIRTIPTENNNTTTPKEETVNTTTNTDVKPSEYDDKMNKLSQDVEKIGLNLEQLSVSQPLLGLTATQVSLSLPFILTDSVGVKGKNNPADVVALKKKFKSLGFNITSIDSNVDTSLVNTINLFQSIIAGREVVSGDGLVSVPGGGNSSYAWLQTYNAPQWNRLDAGSKTDRTIGFFNSTHAERDDYGTNWLIDSIKQAGSLYYNTHLVNNPNASIIYVNDLSELNGGDVDDHQGHETGLLVDLLLPKKDGTSGQTTHENSNYDRDAARAIIQSFNNTKLGVKKVFFNDPILIREGLCRPLKGHHDHIHVQINVPVKKIEMSV